MLPSPLRHHDDPDRCNTPSGERESASIFSTKPEIGLGLLLVGHRMKAAGQNGLNGSYLKMLVTDDEVEAIGCGHSNDGYTSPP
jgi:hypothetical protein